MDGVVYCLLHAKFILIILQIYVQWFNQTLVVQQRGILLAGDLVV